MILKITITYFIICALMGIISLVLSVFDVEVGDRLAHLTIVFGGHRNVNSSHCRISLHSLYGLGMNYTMKNFGDFMNEYEDGQTE